MFHLLHFVSFLLGGVLGLDLVSGSALRNLEGADESDNGGGLDPEG